MINPPLSELTYEIGGMPVVVEGGVSMPSLERMDSMAPFRIEAEVQDVLLHWQLDAGVSAPLVPASFDMPVGNGRCRVYAETGRVLCELCAVRGGTGRPTSMWVEYNLSTGRACLTTMPSRWLHFGLWLAYNMQASARGCFALHASAVVCDGRAVLFLGESGTGKSTHAQLWCKSFNGCRLLNDDSPVVAAVDGGLRVYGRSEERRVGEEGRRVLFRSVAGLRVALERQDPMLPCRKLSVARHRPVATGVMESCAAVGLAGVHCRSRALFPADVGACARFPRADAATCRDLRAAGAGAASGLPSRHSGGPVLSAGDAIVKQWRSAAIAGLHRSVSSHWRSLCPPAVPRRDGV